MKKTRISQNPIITSTMTLWGKSSRLMLLASALFVLFFTSCEDPLKVGENVKPGEDLLATKTIDIPLSTQEILFDSILVSAPGQRPSSILFGHSHDQEIGNLDATAFTQVIVAATNVALTDQPTLKDFYIDGKFNYFYGNQFSNQIVQVFQLDETPNDSVALYSNYSVAIGNKIGEDTLDLEPVNDTHFKIPLNKTLGQNLLDKAYNQNDDSTFVKQGVFNDYFHGLALKLVDNTNSMLGLDLTADTSVMHISYTYPNDDSVYVLNFRLGGASFHHISFQPGQIFKSANIEPNTSFELNQKQLLMLNGIGICPLFNLDAFYNFKDTLSKNIEINRADLHFGPIEKFESNFIQKRPPSTLLAYYLNESNNFVASEGSVGGLRTIQVNGASQLGASNSQNFNYSNSTFNGDVTYFLQEILDGALETKPYRFVLYPSDISNIKYSVDRFLLDSGSLRLKIQYTELKNQ